MHTCGGADALFGASGGRAALNLRSSNVLECFSVGIVILGAVLVVCDARFAVGDSAPRRIVKDLLFVRYRFGGGIVGG